MTYKNITKAIFFDRPNRFIAHVSVNGIVRTAHVKNTGRCKELLIPGAEVWLTASDNPLRKTAYDLVAVRKPTGILLNIDSQAPNKVAYEWLKKQHFELLAKPVKEIFDNLEAGYAAKWKERVSHYTVPIFAPNTKGAWGTRFDDVIAEALEAGPLRTEEYVLPEEIEQKLNAAEMPDKCMKYAKDLTAFYYANRQDDYDWVILPVVNFNAYYGATTFEKKYLPILPEKIFVRETIHGLCRFKVML